MKKQFLLIIFGLSFFFVNAQGNLQFNQVLTYSGSLSYTTNISPTYTVPSGKVWKIEYTTGNRDGLFLLINNISTISLTGNPNWGLTPLIFWLKANDFIKFIFETNNLALTSNYFVSIIEYNIVP